MIEANLTVQQKLNQIQFLESRITGLHREISVMEEKIKELKESLD
jgi:prefoldin subunit 5